MMKNKNNRGKAAIVIGLVFLLAAAGLTAYNIYDNARAQAQTAQTLEQFIVPTQTTQSEPAVISSLPLYELYPEMEMPVTEIDGMYYIGILELPTLGLQLPVLSTLNDSNLTAAPCRYDGSVYLDNLIIGAHNYTSHFGTLRDLAYGDRIVFTDADGNVFRYDVAEIELLTPTDVQEMKTSGYALTLFTCTVGGGSRVTVRCTKTA